MAERLSDRVKHFFTINEFRSFVDAGYRGTEAQIGGGKNVHLVAPPELQLPTAEFNQVRYHTVLAHRLAAQAIRARGLAGTMIMCTCAIRGAAGIPNDPDQRLAPQDGLGVAEVMYWAQLHIKSLWEPEAIFITENGCAATNATADDGNIYDTDRVMFVRACLTQPQRATSEGVPVNGYFLWSAQDNFEWISATATASESSTSASRRLNGRRS